MKPKLIVATDRHFAWMLGEARGPKGLMLPAGGVETVETLRMLRELAASLRRRSCRASWLVVADTAGCPEVVGLISLLHAPDGDGQALFGYGVAASRRGQGYGQAMVAALLAHVRTNPTLRTLTAETRVDNLVSQWVLAKNGFVRLGSRIDPEDGVVVVWQRDVRRWYLPNPKHLARGLAGHLASRVRRFYPGAPHGLSS